MTGDRLTSLAELQTSMDYNMEIFFNYGSHRYMLAPDPTSDDFSDHWIIVRQDDEDNDVKLASSKDVMNYQIDGKPIKKIWQKFTNVEI